MAQAQYYVEINNDYLKKHRRVTGRTRREVELKVLEQQQRWSEQERRARERDAVADVRERARLATDNAQALLEEYRNILNSTLSVDDRLDWASMMDQQPFAKPRPTIEQAYVHEEVPEERPFLERLKIKSKPQREAAIARASTTLAGWTRAWERERDIYEAARAQRKKEVKTFRSAYESGQPEAIERYVSLVLANSSFPDGFQRECKVKYSVPDKTMLVEVVLPTLDDIPSTIEYRYVATRRTVDEKKLKDKEVASLYDDVIVQTALRTVHEIFEGVNGEHCSLVVFNGVIHGVDRGTGRDFEACIVSMQAERGQFLEFDLRRVDPRTCFRTLKGVSGASLSSMQPVRPIRVFDKEDPRFIEVDGVLDGLEHGQNLMTMAWQDFEVLVRDLFQEVFKPAGGDVRVTRTSRDQGVDAVIFDPDPITGGKTVVQAKRYRGAVPVAAVRELFGTMMNEGAGKGILVTTSHFGASASEFAKDKPMTLIDGAQLLHLMQNHGHKVRIDVNESADDELLGIIPGGS
jgi:restriction system protein